MIDRVALKNELRDSKYAAEVAKTNATNLAAMLNALGLTKVPTERLSAIDLLECISIPELASFSSGQLAYIQLVISAGELNLDNFKEAALLFPSGSVSEQNFNKRIQRLASRAEELFGRGAIVTIDDVGACL